MQRKRISIRIEHTEITLLITEVSNLDRNSQGTTSRESAPPGKCPVCGSPWLPNFRDLHDSLGLTAARLKLVTGEAKLHLFCAPTNEVCVCERSLQEIRGKSSLPNDTPRRNENVR
jgi:hypothetical protein